METYMIEGIGYAGETLVEDCIEAESRDDALRRYRAHCDRAGAEGSVGYTLDDCPIVHAWAEDTQ